MAEYIERDAPHPKNIGQKSKKCEEICYKHTTKWRAAETF